MSTYISVCYQRGLHMSLTSSIQSYKTLPHSIYNIKGEVCHIQVCHATIPTLKYNKVPYIVD